MDKYKKLLSNTLIFAIGTFGSKLLVFFLTPFYTSVLTSEELGVGEEKARRLHLNMLIYTIGLSAIFSTARPGIPADEIFGWQSSAYEAFLAQLKEEDRDEP